jgi:hypothetical protein
LTLLLWNTKGIQGGAMTDSAKPKVSLEDDVLAPIAAGPLVFISHDSRDADVAEAFSKLLQSVSAGMIKTFRSSDKKGTEGIDFGDEWYKRLMAKLQSTSDVVCLFMERSLDSYVSLRAFVLRLRKITVRGSIVSNL